ncbi:hypothetical protein QVD17_00042 [Tagetes erecta]|uniref:poly(A)-specific ribonuclease n=1 Tax=Tagetes erecta TaxID=13708 RepID=A0AAD8LAV4_TARER|nr:hypothetical protein QVD17_00042 [Tagetes erecta]
MVISSSRSPTKFSLDFIYHHRWICWTSIVVLSIHVFLIIHRSRFRIYSYPNPDSAVHLFHSIHFQSLIFVFDLCSSFSRESGIDFKKNNEKGIDARRFGELLMSSGIVLNDNVYWVTFHSGYDFRYLLKVLTCKNLPDTQTGFFNLINMFFPTIYDIKHLMKFCNSLHGGLNKLAQLLEVERIGICHQAGSDSLLTSCTFRKLIENFFSGSLDKYAGVLYGLGVEN